MRIKGRKLEGPNVEFIVIPRSEGDIVFKARAVLDDDNFKKLCPEPKMPERLERGKGIVKNPEDPGYKKELEQYGTKKTHWIILESLKATEDLEWESVVYDNPETWHLYEQELKASGFGQFEINRITQLVLDANCLSEGKMEEARKRFLAGQERTPESPTTQITELTNTPSGELANGSVSVHQK